MTRTERWPAQRIEATYNGDGFVTLLVLINFDERREEERAASGRFTTRDLLTSQAVGPGAGGHPYVHAQNDPLDMTDPLGLLATSTAAGHLADFAAIPTSATMTAARQANARNTVANTVAALAAGGGDHTSLHTLAVARALFALAAQMAVRFVMNPVLAADQFHTEVRIPPIPGTTATPGDNMALRVPIVPSIDISGWQWMVYSYTPLVPLGAVLYGPFPMPKPVEGPEPVRRPQPRTQPQTQPQQQPWYYGLEPWHWHMPQLPPLPAPNPGATAAAGGGAGALLLIGLVVLAF